MLQLMGSRQRIRRRQCFASALALMFVALLGLLGFAQSASSQVAPQPLMRFVTRPRQPPAPPAPPADSPMLVQADQIKYDYPNNQVAAVGNVQIYYRGATIEADEVDYDQKAKRLKALGNVRLTEPNGQITYGQTIDLTDDYRDGFVDSLRLETPDDTRFAAQRADRTQGNLTVLQNGVYTACEACKDDPAKPPLWQVKAARIIHDQGEKMLYFEDATVDFFGLPLAWFPFMSAPDPTVKRKSGILFPVLSDSHGLGYGVEVPYYLALSPSYDMTLYPKYMTQQGAMMEGEWEQRLLNGSYSIHAAGIFQQDPSFFAGEYGPNTPETKNFRGSVLTVGQFDITDHWTWGWSGLLITDPTFISDYGMARFNGSSLDPFRTNTAPGTGVSQLYLDGQGDRSYFDLRTIYYTGLSTSDVQGQLPVILPVLDYSRVLGQQVLGGELSYKFNLTSLTRQDASYDPISQAAINNGICANGTPETADPALLTKANCLLRGIPGTYTRASGELDWRRTVITDNGQEITPFFQIRGDIASAEIQNQPGVSNYIQTGDSELARVMPVAGLEYHYPFIDVEPWGTQTIEPIAQLILRPNEADIGKFPNEDAQSLVFDDSNLFSVDKFSGWDRVEGGGRVNAGLEYTAQFNRAGTVNAMFGQSYQIFGQNSFSAGDITNAGLDSGLDKTLSDYVGRLSFQPNSTYMVSAHARFDEATFNVKSFELEGRANFDRWGFNLLYGDYAAQPDLGFLTQREGLLAGTSYKLTQNWVVVGQAGYDLINKQFNLARVGIGYVDDCFMLGFNYVVSYAYNGTPNPIANNSFVLQISLRTLGPDILAQSGAY